MFRIQSFFSFILVLYSAELAEVRETCLTGERGNPKTPAGLQPQTKCPRAFMLQGARPVNQRLVPLRGASSWPRKWHSVGLRASRNLLLLGALGVS